MQQDIYVRLNKKKKLVACIALGMVAVLLVAIVVLVWRWPFSRQAVLKQLEDGGFSKVEVESFRNTYFPRPGCVLEHVTFRHNTKAGSPPLMTIQKLRIESSFPGLFTKHIRFIRAEGLHVFIPPRGSDEHFQAPKRSTVVIDKLIADGGSLEVASREAKNRPLLFSFHNFSLSDIGSRGPALFQARFSNPEPPGEITASGKFGPWNENDVGKTVVSGEYRFEQADLGVFGGIAGILSSSGKFAGVLNRIEVQGQTDTPRFSVARSSHQVQLRTQFHAVVNAENGDTFLNRVDATFWKTTVSSAGSITGGTDKPGKTATIELAAQNGRIQDLLLLFARSQRAPMSGNVGFHAKVSIPPGERLFLKKVELTGDFGIDAGSFTKPNTQEGVNRLSRGGLAKENRDKTQEDIGDSDTVLSDLKGHVLLKNGTANFSSLSFSVPGALAQLQGTYNLITERIDLHGTLRTRSEPSGTTQGMKAMMLKVLNPFFKRKPQDYVMPIKITGTYDHPAFGLDLANGGDKRHPKQNPPGA